MSQLPADPCEDGLACQGIFRDGPLAQGSLLMAWTLLVVAGVLEIGWAIGLKFTEGFTRPWPSS